LKMKELWNSQVNDYGPDWREITLAVRRRDGLACSSCGKPETGKAFDVHHKIPFKAFHNRNEANKMDNLITLCPSCHRAAEKQVYVQSGLAGLAYLLGNLAPLFLMCSSSDIKVIAEFNSALADNGPALVFYDNVPGGVGLSEKVFSIQDVLFDKALQIVISCECRDGCPSCVGPTAENGAGARKHVRAMIKTLLGIQY